MTSDKRTANQTRPHRLFQKAFVPFAFACLTLTAVTSAWGVAFIGYPGQSAPPTDVTATPDRIYSWDVGQITWKMDSDFTAYFPTSALQEQVRLAFEEWEDASTSAIKRANPNYSWRRYNGQQDFHDLRTVVNHEIGHVLGSQHPDASWFNNGLNRNYLPDGNGGWIPGAPLGGELMNEGNDANSLPNSKPDGGLDAGEIHRLISKDELAFLDYAYNGPIDFVQVGGEDPADIVLTIHNINGQPGNNLGSAGVDDWVWRDENDQDAGRRITKGILSLNANPKTPMGMKARPAKWQFTNNTGKDIVELALQTRGTDNRKATDINSSGAHRFTKLKADNVIFVPHLEDTRQVFSQPIGGSIPNGSQVSAGLQLDTWDWQLVDADAKASDNSSFDVELLTIFEWANNGDPIPPTPGDTPNFDFIAGDPEGLPSKSYDLRAKGFRLLNSTDGTTVVSELALAAVPDMSPSLDMLGDETRDQLAASGALVPVTFSPITLDPGEEFIFVLDGTIDDLPPELVTAGNFMLLGRPDLADPQLFVYAASGTAAEPNLVGNYTFLNTGLYVPEPSTALLLLSGLGLMFVPRRGRGFSV